MTVEYDADEAPRRGQPVSHPQFGLEPIWCGLSSGLADCDGAVYQWSANIACGFSLLGRDDGGDFWRFAGGQ